MPEFWSRMTKRGKVYRETLRFVLDIAIQAVANAETTLMGPDNMGIVFAYVPTTR